MQVPEEQERDKLIWSSLSNAVESELVQLTHWPPVLVETSQLICDYDNNAWLLHAIEFWVVCFVATID